MGKRGLLSRRVYRSGGLKKRKKKREKIGVRGKRKVGEEKGLFPLRRDAKRGDLKRKGNSFHDINPAPGDF